VACRPNRITLGGALIAGRAFAVVSVLQKQQLNNMKIETGLMIMKDGKAWGVTYEDGYSRSCGWIDPESAPIYNPQYVKTPLSITYHGSPYIQELGTAELVNVRRFTTVEMILKDQPVDPNPICPRCKSNNQVWKNQITDEIMCHRVGCKNQIIPQFNDAIDALRVIRDLCQDKTIEVSLDDHCKGVIDNCLEIAEKIVNAYDLNKDSTL